MLDLDLHLFVHRQMETLGLPRVWANMLVDHLQERQASLDEGRHILERLSQGEHLVRILGWTYFSGHRFTVFEAVLMPRFDTEVLVEAVSLKPGDVVADWCTGTGCVGLSLALREEVAVFLLDKFQPPCQNASDNVTKYHLNHRVQVLQADCYESWPFEQVDVIVANPPYIDGDHSCLQGLMQDPLTALVAENRGLAFYQRLLSVGRRHLRQGGQMCLEIGFNQAPDVLQLAKHEGWQIKQVLQDFGGRNRVIVLENRGF